MATAKEVQLDKTVDVVFRDADGYRVERMDLWALLLVAGVPGAPQPWRIFPVAA